MTELQLRAQICEVGRWMWQRGIVGAIEGNISCRLTEKTLLCTPASKHKGTLRPEDIAVTNYNGETIGTNKPSSELQLHLEIYEQRPDCLAVVHAHPPIATAFALVGETIPDNYLPEAAVVLGSVALVPFAMPGTTEMRDVIRPYLEFHKSFLLSQHGAVTLGNSLFDAFTRMETLERICNVLHVANQLGTPRPLPKEAFELLLESSLNSKL